MWTRTCTKLQLVYLQVLQWHLHLHLICFTHQQPPTLTPATQVPTLLLDSDLKVQRTAAQCLQTALLASGN